ncbi:helix-turn-helix domain-containing protein [Enterococcus faecalis]|nr:helix-turn-helix domain-containing protein [Enterococcus faecalis]MCO8258221.1 helix-turn-helix domain-containing protein [Enterococcus faecalis]MCP8906283.1 helix-turn-helix domain-containing protein [Enterococcus faecalis]MCP8912271.1 helix-turn-helix domain-containing protein [Enterococcus faecalis]MCP8960312.1 helix-turn-helix domain-containing protein [Enterococcus faecalis]MCR1937617.1 helix-turn-helix domain-containing protein [Enterococcus faecalis]
MKMILKHYHSYIVKLSYV